MKITKRQWEVCQLIARGYTQKQIAKQFMISPRTVEDHLQNAYHAHGVNSIMGLIARLTQQGLPCPCCGRGPVVEAAE